MSLKKAAKSSSMKSKHSAVEQAEQPDEDEVEANTSECHTTLPDTPEAERRMDRLGISVSKGESTIRLITPSSSQQLSNLSPSTVDVATLFPPLLPMKDDVSPRLAYPTPPLAPDTSMEDLAPMPGSFFQVSRSLPPPSPAFVFGSPRHSVSNNQFRSAAGAVLEEMNRRMGVDATSSAGLTLDILSAKPALPALPSNPSKPKTETGIKFDHAHKRTFDKYGCTALYLFL